MRHLLWLYYHRKHDSSFIIPQQERIFYEISFIHRKPQYSNVYVNVTRIIVMTSFFFTSQQIFSQKLKNINHRNENNNRYSVIWNYSVVAVPFYSINFISSSTRLFSKRSIDHFNRTSVYNYRNIIKSNLFFVNSSDIRHRHFKFPYPLIDLKISISQKTAMKRRKRGQHRKWSVKYIC